MTKDEMKDFISMRGLYLMKEETIEQLDRSRENLAALNKELRCTEGWIRDAEDNMTKLENKKRDTELAIKSLEGKIAEHRSFIELIGTMQREMSKTKE